MDSLTSKTQEYCHFCWGRFNRVEANSINTLQVTVLQHLCKILGEKPPGDKRTVSQVNQAWQTISKCFLGGQGVGVGGLQPCYKSQVKTTDYIQGRIKTIYSFGLAGVHHSRYNRDLHNRHVSYSIFLQISYPKPHVINTDVNAVIKGPPVHSLVQFVILQSKQQPVIFLFRCGLYKSCLYIKSKTYCTQIFSVS